MLRSGSGGQKMENINPGLADQTTVTAENHERTKTGNCLEIKSDPPEPQSVQQMFNVQIFGSKKRLKCRPPTESCLLSGLFIIQ